jgi:hypothetical protein
LLRPSFVVAVLVVVFGWLLQFIDYDDVWAAHAKLDGWEVVVLLGLGLARVPSEAPDVPSALARVGTLAWE